MSQHDENKRERSVNLCQLVYDRKLDCEIDYEIRKLTEHGVLIDFQDQNRDQKTAIHLAVDKCDATCVKFLLRFKPNLSVRDENGKTPVELAELKGDQNIINVLVNSTVEGVNESFIGVIDFQGLTRQKVEAIISQATFKVLKLTNCPSVNEVWMKMNDHAYTFDELSHLFFIAIETNETNIQNDDELMKKVLNLRRPMIIQLTSLSSQRSRTFFKDDQKDFMEITDMKISQEEFTAAVQSDHESDLKLLVEALRSNLFGHCTGSLLDTKLNTNEDRNEAVNHFAKTNALCHRFFKLFDESPTDIDRIVATLSFKGDQSLLALLDLPFEIKDKKLKLNETQQDILSVVDLSGCNLLMMAVEQRNLDAVKVLLRCDCDFNHLDDYDKRASDICWEMKSFDCLAELIEAGSPYPSNFCIDDLDESSEAHERINKMIEAINSFHEHIKHGKTEEVKKFVASHPHIKHAFDTNNKCALTVALQSTQVDIYSLLMSEGFEPGADDKYQNACSESKFKNEIRNSHRKYFKKAFDEPHLKRLLNMSRLSFGSKDRAKCSTIIRRMFDELNEIDEVIPILKICSLSDKLKIVFDFNCDSVVDMDPSKESSSLAAVYPSDGFIYIGAQNYKREFCEVVGNLIHELTHYAMKLTYENSCKPYDVDDIEKTQLFENISAETKKICDENPSTDSIVTIAFTYTGEFWHQELIVRVPQLLAHYKKNLKALETTERNTPELFYFYRETTLKDVQTKYKSLIHKYSISKINNQTGIARRIENLNVKFENVQIDLKPSFYVITSSAPQLTLAFLHQALPSNSHIFVTLEQVAFGNILEKIAKVNAKESSAALIVDCIEQAQKYPESLRKLLKDVKHMKTIALVMTETESSKVKENFSKVGFKTFDHKWGELTESSKIHLLNQNVIFQGIEIKLNELVEPASEAMNFFPLGELASCKEFKIGKELHQTSPKFYISRKFIRKGQRPKRATTNTKSFEVLLRDESRMGAMIISDEAGSGKSVTLLEIAKSLNVAYNDRWVLFVDLKRHIEAFKGVECFEKIESFEDFVVQNILKNEPKFDRELFKQMFRAGKTFVLFDGFDEISPNYKDLLLHVLSLYESDSGNQLYITTRPHLEAELEGALRNYVFKLETFSRESQEIFLRKYWLSVGFKLSPEDFEILLHRLLEKFSEISSSNIVGLPLLLRMTAEIFEGPIKEIFLTNVGALKISSVFQNFVEKYLARWTNNENEISRNETVEFVMAGGILEVHHNIAINHIFGGKFISFDVKESDAEKISRVGLIRYDKTEKTFQFLHETFAEYFVADFIRFHLNRKNRNPLSHECRLAVEVLVEVVFGIANFRVIRIFLDQSVDTINFDPCEAFYKSVANCLSEFLKSKNLFDFPRRSMGTKRENLQILMFTVLKYIEKDVLMKILLPATQSEESTLLHASILLSRVPLSILCGIISSCTDNPKQIYQDEGSLGNVLFQAAYNIHAGVLTTLCANLNSALTRDEIKIMFQQKDVDGRNIIGIAAHNSCDEIFPELISLLPNYLSADEIKSLLLAVNVRKQNFFHQAVVLDTRKSLKLKFDVIKSNFDTEQQKAFFSYQPVTAPNMFHCAAVNRNEKIFETIIESTRDVLSSDEIKFALIEKDSQGSNVLHCIAERGHVSGLIGLTSLLRERLSDDEIRRLLLEVNSEGQNCFRLATNNDKLNFHFFCETIGNLLTTENQTRLLQESYEEINIIRLACGNYNTNEIVPVAAIKYLLTKADQQGRNVFNKVAFHGDVESWNKLISFAKARFSAEEMKSFLFSCDRNGKNCLNQAISNNSGENMVEAICNTIKTVLIVEDQQKMVRQKDSEKRNVFHQAAMRFDISSFYCLYDLLGVTLSRELLKEKDSAGDNILLCSKGVSPLVDGTSHNLINFLEEVLTSDEIKNLFFGLDGERRNFFHCTVGFLSKLEIKSQSKAIKKVLSRSDQKKFFGIKSPNVFHLAVGNLHLKVFSTLCEILKDVLTENEVKALIQGKDSENKNILHSICQSDLNDLGPMSRPYSNYSNEERLRDLLKVLKDVLTDEELKNFLKSSDNNGRNCLLLAAQFKCQIFLEELFSFIQSLLSDDDLRELFLKCDNDGKNIFTCASVNEVPEILSFIEQFAKEIQSEYHVRY